ncbi:hypothetical protein SAMN05421594_2728 [Chryseobacterium oleae]|uniref:Uncharacterized protein n=1 Tax=Chryseobacterium oleae TaxID=491207 RepID=A0A1I4YWD4_CHROL|nr:hypothetical protein SAMN05421594_2728 [Chryseobacterium oleae]
MQENENKILKYMTLLKREKLNFLEIGRTIFIVIATFLLITIPQTKLHGCYDIVVL